MEIVARPMWEGAQPTHSSDSGRLLRQRYSASYVPNTFFSENDVTRRMLTDHTLEYGYERIFLELMGADFDSKLLVYEGRAGVVELGGVLSSRNASRNFIAVLEISTQQQQSNSEQQSQSTPQQESKLQGWQHSCKFRVRPVVLISNNNTYGYYI